jgi:hypothetical protein
MYFSHRHGIFTESLWDEIEPTMSDVIAYPGTRHWWATPRHWHTQEFAHVVDEIIARGHKPIAYSIFNLLRQRWQGAIGDATSPATLESQKAPQNQWQVHPLIDGCQPAIIL